MIWITILAAVVGTGLAALPLVVSRRKSLLNPALYVFLAVVYSLLLKTLYIAVFRTEAPTSGTDRIYGTEGSSDFLLAGAVLILIAVVAYVAGYFLTGKRKLPLKFRDSARQLQHAWISRYAATAMVLVCLASFVAFLVISDPDLGWQTLSAKRFNPADTGADTRFGYLPYYLFKIALTVASVGFATSFLLLHANSPSEERRIKYLLAVAFILSIATAHFASLRIFLLLLVLQIGLLVVYLKGRRHLMFMGAFALLAISSFVWISLIERTGVPASELHSEEEGDGTGGGAPSRGIGLRLRPLFEGRYLLDVAKTAHVAHYFPKEAPHHLGASVLGTLPSSEPDVRESDRSLGNYLARAVFHEPDNNVNAGFLGELYVNFSYVGVIVGFLALGALHRLMFNHLLDPHIPILIAVALVALIPTTSALLLNSGIVPAGSRSVVDIAVLLAIWIPGARAWHIKRAGTKLDAASP